MKIAPLIALSMMSLSAFSQNKDTTVTHRIDSLTTKVFQLGEVKILATKEDELTGRISREKMEIQNRFDVSNSLNVLPGISMTASGPRNESMVSVRGFDLRAVPVYMDGIPVYVPYDGYVDLARFTTFDLAAIDVSKGFSSMLYGPNSLGGAINLISRKPTRKLEYDGSVGMINTNGFRGNVNVGSNLGKFFVQAGYSYLFRESSPMSMRFTPHAHEDGGARGNSFRRDQKINAKVGWTPNARNEYVVGFIDQRGRKGTPVYAGNDSLNSLIAKPRYWQWPVWNKQTYYFMSRSEFNSNLYLKSRAYYDIFKNTINSYDDSTYTSQTKPYAFTSNYKDYTYGGSLELGTTYIPKNELKLSAHYKNDMHRENNVGDPVQHYQDITFNAGLEDIYRISDKVTLVPGFSYSFRKNLKAENYNSKLDTMTAYGNAGFSHAFNGQLGVFYSFMENQEVSLTVSRKSRFATIKDRYSYKMGTAIPNTELRPEVAYSVDLSYSATFFKNLSGQASFFYSRLTDAILSVNNVDTSGHSQMQNAGAAEFVGIELSAKYDLRNMFTVGSNYTYLERHNITDPTVLFTDIPNSKLFSYVQYKPLKLLQFMLSAEYNSARYSTSYGTKAPAYALINASITVKVWKYIGVQLGMNNIFDKNYMLVEGYPEEGRNFYVTLRFSDGK